MVESNPSLAGMNTLGDVELAMEQKQCASLVAVTTLLDTLSRKGDTVSLGELSSLVKCDAPLIARVLARANTLECKGNYASVRTLPEAFHVLGIDRLRNVILSTLLAQHANTENQAQREMAVVSLTNGILAQVIATECGEDSEQAFLCGALRNYGHLLLATFYPERFDRARALGIQMKNEDEGFLAVFGIQPRVLAHQLLAQSQLPREIMNAISRDGDTAQDCKWGSMTAYAICAQSLGALLFDPLVAPIEFRAQARALLQHFAPDATIQSDEDLTNFLSQHRDELSSFAQYGGFRGIAERPVHSLCRRIGNKTLHRSPVVPGRTHATTVPIKVSHVLKPGGLGRVIAGLGADVGILFDLDPTIGSFVLTRSTGAWSHSLEGAAAFKAGDRNLFGLCAALNQTLLIHNTAAKNILGHIPAWMQHRHCPASLFLQPFGENKCVTQVLLVGWTKPIPVVKAPSPQAILAYAD